MVDYGLDEYQVDASRTMNGSSSSEAALGLAGETGEVVDYLKKVLYHAHPLNQATLGQELGDVLWYVSALCTHFGLSLEGVAKQNIQKLTERYPDGFSFERSIHRKLEP